VSTSQSQFERLIFLNGWTDEDAESARDRGYLSHVLVETSDTLLYPVTFYDATRLVQDLEEQGKQGAGFIADPAMIVLAEITLETMEGAVRTLCAQGYFRHFQSVERAILTAAPQFEWPPPRT
jgi:hypothetical protein